MKQGLTFLAILLLAAAAIWYSLTPIDPATGHPTSHGELVALGLDLKGGLRVTLEPDPTKLDNPNVSRETMDLVRNVIENRVNSFGLSGTEVRLKGENQVLVVLPGAKNPDEALKTISTVAQLEFRYLANVRTSKNPGPRYRMDVAQGDAAKGDPDTYKFFDTQTNQPVPQEEVLKESELILRGNLLLPKSQAMIDPTSGRPLVTFELNGEGAKTFGDFTSNHVGEILAVVLDKAIISAPVINEPITEGHGQITGSKTMGEGRVLANLLNSGALPIPLRPAETQYVGATLGRESVERSIHAGLVGLCLVLVFMLLYYWLPGFLACVALIIYAALTFSIFKGMGLFKPIPLDLPGITGFILSVGMAVDANILIFERLKEELRSGKTLHAAVDAGFSRAFTSIFDSNVTTWIVCAVLIWLGTPIIRGFAITLAIGVAVSMFTAITVTRTMLHLVMELPWARQESLYALNVSWLGLVFPAWRQGGVLRVFDKRAIYFGFTLLLGAVALVFIILSPFGLGLKPGIDFTGGTVIEAALRNPDKEPEEALRSKVETTLHGVGVRDAVVRIGWSERPWTQVEITANDVDEPTGKAIKDRLGKTTGLEAFDPDAYKESPQGKTFKATAIYTGEVNKEQILRALQSPIGPSGAAERPLVLNALNVTTTPILHTGANRVPIAEITTAMHPHELQNLVGGKSSQDPLTGRKGGQVKPSIPAPAAPAASNTPAPTRAAGPAPAASNVPAAGATAAANAPAALNGAAGRTGGPVVNGPAAINSPTGNAPAANAPAANAPAANAPTANAPAANAPAVNAPAGKNAPAAAPAAAKPGEEKQGGQSGQAIKGILNSIAGGVISPMFQENSIGPSVAKEVTWNAFFSVVVASLAIILYLAFRFAIGGFVNGLKFGSCAVIALIHDVGIVIGFFALMGLLQGWKVDSLFVTAVLTVLGFSVHDTIVVYDRIRENLSRRLKGETFADVSDRSITQTFDRSINTSFTVMLVVAALVFFGGASIRLFNIALLFGIAIGTYSSIFVASPLVVLLERAVASRAVEAPAAPAAARSRPSASDVALTPRSRRDATVTPSRAGAVTTERPAPSEETGAEDGATGTDDGVDRSRPGTIRPRKKRRM